MIIAFSSKPSRKGGPGSFQRKFEMQLREFNWIVVYPDDKITPDVIIILGGTRKLFWLLRMKFKGAKIFFRFGGINWLYKFKQISHFKRLYLDLKIFLSPFIQKYFADGIIYQSSFSKEWLLKLGQSAIIINNEIIYNGVDLNKFKPTGMSNSKEISLLCVEGNIDYSPYAVELLNQLQEKLIKNSEYKYIILYGNFENIENKNKLHPDIDYRGFINRDDVNEIYKSAVYLSLDVNAACPNTVIEALASGIPVIGYDTGALKELVPAEAGEIVPYGGDSWELEFPNIENLVYAAVKVIKNWNHYSENARIVAEQRYSIKNMANQYIKFFNGSVQN